MAGVSTQSSWRSFRVVRRETLSKGVTGFTLFPTDAGPVTPYLPGQGVSVRATVPEAGFLTSHPFALTHASSPEDNTLTFAVEKIPGDTTSEGRLCRYLTEEVHTGAVIEVSAPTGEFTIDTKETMPVVFLADRLGIAPVFTMVDALAIENPGRSVTVLYLPRRQARRLLLEAPRHGRRTRPLRRRRGNRRPAAKGPRLRRRRRLLRGRSRRIRKEDDGPARRTRRHSLAHPRADGRVRFGPIKQQIVDLLAARFV